MPFDRPLHDCLRAADAAVASRALLSDPEAVERPIEQFTPRPVTHKRLRSVGRPGPVRSSQ